MADAPAIPYGRATQREPAAKEVHILWSPDGLGCDGDTISTTAATQPSIEDIVMGAIPLDQQLRPTWLYGQGNQPAGLGQGPAHTRAARPPAPLPHHCRHHDGAQPVHRR